MAVSEVLSFTSVQAAILEVDPPGTPNGCTLERAINTANSGNVDSLCGIGVGSTTINLPANTLFNLTTSLPTIESTVTLNGNGSIIQRDNTTTELFSVLFVDEGSLTVENTTISGGFFANGGGIRAYDSTISLVNTTVTGNQAASGGGILTVDSTVDIIGSTISENYASNDGGMSLIDSTVTITNSSLSSNSASSANGAAAISLLNSKFILQNSSVDGNYSIGNSTTAGLYISAGSASIVNSTVSDNFGGGILSRSVSLFVLENSVIRNNNAVFGGGGIYIVEGVSSTIINSTISDNTAELNGGGINARDGYINIINSTLSGNTALNNGGGISANTGVMLFNSTVSGNVAMNKGGELFLDNLYNDSISIVNSTLFGNRADLNNTNDDSGGAIYVGSNAGSFNMYNTVLTNSAPADCGGQKPMDDPLLGNTNWFEDSSCGGGGEALGDPKLGPLQFNGGPTKTHAPLVGSGLAGAGSSLICQSSGVNNKDQRGETRNDPCFIGSVDDIIDTTSFYVIPLADGKTVVIPL